MSHDAELEQLERVHRRAHLVPALFLRAPACMFSLDCPPRVRGDSPGRLSSLLKQVCVIAIDAGKLGRQRAVSLGAVSFDLRFKRCLEIAQHEPYDVVGGSRRNLWCTGDCVGRGSTLAARHGTADVRDILRYASADAEIEHAALDDVLRHHPTRFDCDAGDQAA
ncbi:MAG: hypothetical protein ACRD2A_14605 [Vicinamibacterales bacterium]